MTRSKDHLSGSEAADGVPGTSDQNLELTETCCVGKHRKKVKSKSYFDGDDTDPAVTLLEC